MNPILPPLKEYGGFLPKAATPRSGGRQTAAILLPTTRRQTRPRRKMAALSRVAATTLLLVLVLNAHGQTYFDGRIYEDDGRPDDLGNGWLRWTYVIENTGTNLVSEVLLRSLFSRAVPSLSSYPWAYDPSILPPYIWPIMQKINVEADYWNCRWWANILPDGCIPPGATVRILVSTAYAFSTNTAPVTGSIGAEVFTPDRALSFDLSGMVGPVGEHPFFRGRLREDDGRPDDLGNGLVGWDFIVDNTSAFPIASARIENLFSISVPAMSSAPTNWSFTALPTAASNMWTLLFDVGHTNLSLAPSNQAHFYIHTTYNPTNRILVTQPRAGAVKFAGDLDWTVPDTSGLVGPFGQINNGAPTLALATTLADDPDQDATRPGRQSALRYVFTNNSPDGVGTGEAPFGLVRLNLPAGTEGGVYRVLPELGCAAWPASLTATETVLDGHAQPLPVGATGAVTLYFDVRPTWHGWFGDIPQLTTNRLTAQAAGLVSELPFEPLPVLVPTAQANHPFGRIRENDGQPLIGGDENIWGYLYRNTANGNVGYIRIGTEASYLYSTRQPLLQSIPFWDKQYIQHPTDTNFWRIERRCTLPSYYVQPGGELEFKLGTYIHNNAHLVYGPRPGAVMFEGIPGIWFTPDVTGLLGPMGQFPDAPPPLPPRLATLALSGNTVTLTATNLAAGWGYTLETSTNLADWTMLPCDSELRLRTPAGEHRPLTLWTADQPEPFGAHTFRLCFPPPAVPARYFRLRCP